MKLINILRESLHIHEDASFAFGGKKLKMRLKPNINPTKEGIRIQFAISNDADDLDPSDLENFTTSLQSLLNKALSPYGMSVNSDPDVPDQGEQVIGYYLTIEQFESFVKKALKDVLKTAKKPSPKTQEDEPSEESSSEEHS